MKQIKAKPLVTVRVINYKFLAQIYHTRGELDSTPDHLNENEIAVGCLVSGAGVIVHDTMTDRVRVVWPSRYSIGQGGKGYDRTILDKLPQIFTEGSPED